MQCHKTIFTSKNGWVPCGQCMQCRINTGRKWTSRILMEQAFHPYRSYFTTLTYAPENIPKCGTDYVSTLRKSDIQKFTKKAYREVGKFRYYTVGEYGTNTLRPHYHMAIFPDANTDVGEINAIWESTKGFTSIYELNSQRASYLANYCTKKLTKDTDDRLEENQEPEFRLSTRKPALGYAAVGAIVNQYTTKTGRAYIAQTGDISRTIRIQGKIYPLTDYILGKARQALGIPLLHTERQNHPNYLEYFETEQNEPDPKTHLELEKLHHAKAFQKIHRTETRNL